MNIPLGFCRHPGRAHHKSLDKAERTAPLRAQKQRSGWVDDADSKQGTTQDLVNRNRDWELS